MKLLENRFLIQALPRVQNLIGLNTECSVKYSRRLNFDPFPRSTYLRRQRAQK